MSATNGKSETKDAPKLVLRQAPFALRVVHRIGGDAGIVYRRMAQQKGSDRLINIGSMSPLAWSAAARLVRGAVKDSTGKSAVPKPGPYTPIDHDWGVRLACFARISTGLRDGSRLSRAAEALYHASGTEAAWWLGQLEQDENNRAVRAMRILTEATA